MKVIQVLYITGLALSASIGIWHFFVPEMFQWYSYIPSEYENLIVGIDWTNFFFSMLLSGYSIILILMRKKVFSYEASTLVMYGFMVFVWFCRVAITFIKPWPLEPIKWASYGQQIAALIVFIMLFIPLFYLVKNRNHKDVDE
jgi:magnesium-transporting ATPase (P-type)